VNAAKHKDQPIHGSPDRRETIASPIPRPHLRRLRPPLPQDLPPPPLLPSCGGGMELIGKQNSLPEAGGRSGSWKKLPAGLLSKVAATGQDSYDKK